MPKRRRKGTVSEAPIRMKPTLTIDSKRLKGDSFRVGKKARVLVSGKIIQESIDDYEVPNRKSFRMEVDKVTSVSKGTKSRRRLRRG